MNIEKFGKMIVQRRGTLGVRAAAKDIGISPATLSRVENGNVPDLATFAAICRWLEEDPSQFLGMQASQSNRESVTVHLRKDKTTSVDTAEALGSMILSVQRALQELDKF